MIHNQENVELLNSVLYHKVQPYQPLDNMIPLIETLKKWECPVDYNRCLEKACRNHFSSQSILYILESGATNVRECLNLPEITPSAKALIKMQCL